MRFCQAVRRTCKKGILTDFFSIIAFVLILLIFYLLFKLTIGSTTFEITTQAGNAADIISLINILKTPVTIDDAKMSIAELIALSQIDTTKKDLMEKKILQIINEAFGMSNCAVICINGRQLNGEGCSDQNYACSNKAITIPTYHHKSIEVSFEANSQPLNLYVK